MPQQDAQRHYDELVRLCYECALDGSKWLELLDRLVQAAERQHGALILRPKHAETAQISSLSTYDSSITEAYNSYYHHLDPSNLFMPQRKPGHWYHDLSDYGEQAIAGSPYYRDFHRKYRLGSATCVKLYEDDRTSACLSLLSSWEKRNDVPPQQGLLDRLTPHLNTAGRVTAQLQRAQEEVAKRDVLLEQQATPLWLLEESGRVVFSNRAAEKLMMDKYFVLFERFGQLHSTQQNSRLQALLLLASGKGGACRAGWLPLSGSPEASLLVTPAPSAIAASIRPQQALVLLTLLSQPSSTQLLAELFQLSPAERRLAEQLAMGHSPKACSSQLGISINTVRTQLRALYRKTNTQKQSELTSLINRLNH